MRHRLRHNVTSQSSSKLSWILMFLTRCAIDLFYSNKNSKTFETLAGPFGHRRRQISWRNLIWIWRDLTANNIKYHFQLFPLMRFHYSNANFPYNAIFNIVHVFQPNTDTLFKSTTSLQMILVHFNAVYVLFLFLQSRQDHPKMWLLTSWVKYPFSYLGRCQQRTIKMASSLLLIFVCDLYCQRESRACITRILPREKHGCCLEIFNRLKRTQ